MSIFFTIIIFMFVILFHEAGHFFMAKKVGIRVNEFSVGMGPALWQKQKAETMYSLRAVPLGGYTAMEGEDEESLAENSYDRASAGGRFLTILAGPVMNLFIAIVCFSVFSGMIGVPTPVVGGFSPNSPVKKAGLQIEDRIIAINGQPVRKFNDISPLLQKNGGKRAEIKILRGQEEMTFLLQPAEEEGKYYLGFTAQNQRNFFLAIKEGFVKTYQLFIELFLILYQLITGSLSLKALSGPIGIIHVIGQAAHQGLSQLIFLTGYLSLNLGFFNLLPIPALDGSKLLFIIIEKIRGKKIPKKVEERITMAGFVFLMTIIIIVSVKDMFTFFL